MPEYCSRDDIEYRLSAQGLRFLADRDQDGDVDETELEQFVDTQIAEAGLYIDQRLHHIVSPAVARASQNEWLKARCIDLATENISRIGGNDPPDFVVITAERARIELGAIESRQRQVPGLIIPKPKTKSATSSPQAKVVNL